VHLLESDFRRMLDLDGDFTFSREVAEIDLMEGRGEIGKGAADNEVDLALFILEFQVVSRLIPSGNPKRR